MLDRQTRRILFLEKVIMMPVKAALVFLSVLFVWTPQDDFHFVTHRFLFYQSVLYAFANVIFYIILSLSGARGWSASSVRVCAFLLAIIDNLYVCFLIPLTGGLESPLYWLFPGLIIRTALDFPDIRRQGVISLAFCVFYGTVVYLTEREPEMFVKEVFYLKLIVMMLLSVCCYGIYNIIMRNVERARDEAELELRRQKIHAVQRMAAEVAHGLKNPLAIINNAIYYLARHFPDGRADLEEHAGIVRDELKRADRILSQVMNYSKLSSLKLVKLDVNRVLNQTIEELRFGNVYPAIGVVRNLARELPRIFWDEGHLKQIFSNLLLNAAEAMGENAAGGGLIRISTVLLPDGAIAVAFEDNGNGIEKSDIARIFDPFFTTKDKGTGLGLSIVKSIVETYDGTIEVSSAKGRGSTFTVVIPVRT